MPRILGLSGSLRADSSSTALVRTLAERTADRATWSRFDIGSLPLYNADLGTPDPVPAWKEAVATADGLVIVTPEYNYSIPGPLKNAIDWASRPAFQSPFRDKPVLVASVSGGALGGVRAQGHLKQTLNGMLAQIFPWPEIVVPQAGAKVADGRIADAAVMEFAVQAFDAFLASLPSR